MSRYRKVYVTTWDDDRFRRLSAAPPNGQTLWFYLLTAPETVNVPGLFRAGEAALSESLRWSLEGFRQAFAEVSAEGMAEADWKARVVWVPHAIRYNEPESPNVVRSWRTAWSEVPNCSLKRKAYHALKDYCEGKGEGFAKAFAEACPQPSPNQEQEQKQEQKTGSGKESASAEATTLEISLNGGESQERTLVALPARVRAKSNGDANGLDGFAAFYAAYPRKRAPGAAEKAWRKLAPNDWLRDTIMAALKAQSASAEWHRDGGAYIPHPATWLNQRRWEDELTPVTATVGGYPAATRGSMGAAAQVAERLRREGKL